MGLSNIFENTADFSGMIDYPAQVSELVQKAFIKMNEEGSEAAVATEADVVLKSACYVERFKVNHPVSYDILHLTTGTILFSGVLAYLKLISKNM